MAKSNPHPFKDQVATIFTHTHTYLIHHDRSWGRYGTYSVDRKGQNIPEGKVRLHSGPTPWLNGIEFDSLAEAFTYVGVDPIKEPDFDLKNRRAWGTYILG